MTPWAGIAVTSFGPSRRKSWNARWTAMDQSGTRPTIAFAQAL
jgi:hypothetical protein